MVIVSQCFRVVLHMRGILLCTGLDGQGSRWALGTSTGARCVLKFPEKNVRYGHTYCFPIEGTRRTSNSDVLRW